MDNLQNITAAQIEELAAKLRSKLQIEDAMFIDITQLTEEIGYDVYEADLEHADMLATYVLEGEKQGIYIDNSLDEPEKRYLIALQLSHIILGHAEGYAEDEFLVDYRNPYKGSSTAEDFGRKAQSKLLALAILMPSDLVTTLWEQTHNVDLLADRFHVPRKIAYSRLDKLGLL